jgi:hypothetical protein
MSIRSFFEKIKNVIRWIPTIWKDHDWDQYYFEQILIFKLKNMRDFFLSEYAYSADAKDRAKEIEEVIQLLEKLEDEYIEEIYPNFDELYEGFELTEEWFNREQSPEEMAISEKRLNIWVEAERRYTVDKKKAFELIADNYFKWWD